MTKRNSYLRLPASTEHVDFERDFQKCPSDSLDGCLHTLYVGVIGRNDIDMVKQVAQTVFGA